MEENKHLEEFDVFAKKYLKEIEVETPSQNFTASLMKRIEVQKTAIFNQDPLISKKEWFGVFCVVLMVLFSSNKTSENDILNLPKIDFSFLEENQISQLFHTISVSSTTMYAFFFFGLMILLQVVFLKNHFDKRFQ